MINFDFIKTFINLNYLLIVFYHLINPFKMSAYSKINSALRRLKDGSYGYCEETSEPIGLKRLMARPVATLSIEAQEKHERDEKIFVED